MRCRALSVLATLSAAFLCGSATLLTSRWDEMKVKHAWDTVPHSWQSLGHPPNQTTIDLHLALKSHREDALVEALYEVSYPTNPKYVPPPPIRACVYPPVPLSRGRYGAYVSREQVAEVVAPHSNTLDLVSSWLENYDIPSSSISATLVPQPNRILGASYQLYQHVETNDTVLRTIGYSLPESLHEHVQTIVPTTYVSSPLTAAMRLQMYPSTGVEAQAKAVLLRREEGVTPSYLRSLYKTMGYVPKATDRNALGIADYGGQFPSPQDLALFMGEYRTDEEGTTFTVTQVNGGGYDPGDPGIEANLIIQYAEAMACPTRYIYYNTGGTPYSRIDDPYLCWLLYVIAQDNVDIPRTISTSYGGYEQIMPLEYVISVCTLFGQLGLRGVSVLFSTGDCVFRDRSGETSVQFLPIFPATCPWVTSVGGTTGHDPEVAASISGGGSSIYFPRQPYQADVISTFLQNFGDKYSGLYNPGGRGFPDISSQVLKLSYVLKGKFQFASGVALYLCVFPTSLCPASSTQLVANAQTVAGVISLLNDYLISKGSTPLGFLNPWLYGAGLPGLNDITSGSNPGCNTDGFPAVAGLGSCLGTLDFAKLEEIIAGPADRLRNSGTSRTENKRST
ncbi:peptidase S8/S53 domain-containing protein [Lactarius akahatsu]|uniref:Peptidase S8/S53 domain-containing protein n=1 Tax=Lactarius akahatsu TaxID=416441 RepID=A0AAD4L951_9AGAM|nr:peptidase S8/S53 domain-containing protein [Lactarius akahatsu]